MRLMRIFLRFEDRGDIGNQAIKRQKEQNRLCGTAYEVLENNARYAILLQA